MLIFGDWHEFPVIWVDIVFWFGFDTRHRVVCFLDVHLIKVLLFCYHGLACCNVLLQNTDLACVYCGVIRR